MSESIAVPLSAPRIMVLGFCFDDEGKRVLLIRKNRPEWMRGKLNGIGGGIEPGETASAAMQREFEEEAGDAGRPGWEHFLTLQGREHPWQVKVFRAFCSGALDQAKSCTDEDVLRFYCGDGIARDVVPNLRWMIPLALDRSLSTPIVLEENP